MGPLLGEDRNGYSPIFGAKKSDTRGNAVEKILHESQVLHLTQDKELTLTNRGDLTPIDVTISFPSIASRVTWKVMNENLGSDHFILQITLDDRTFKETSKIQRLKPKRTDWTLFREESSRLFSSALPYNDLDRNAAFISESIIAAASLNTPQKSIKNPIRPSVPYWNKIVNKPLRIGIGLGTFSGLILLKRLWKFTKELRANVNGI